MKKGQKPPDPYKIMGYRAPERKMLPGEAALRAKIFEAHRKRQENEKKRKRSGNKS